MAVSAAHHGFDQHTVIRQQQQPFRVFIQSARISDPHRIFNFIRYDLLRMGIPLRTYHTFRLIICQNDLPVPACHLFSANKDFLLPCHLKSRYGDLSVNRPDQFIRIPPGTDPAIRQIFI